MGWFRMKRGGASTRGRVKMVWPLESRVQGFTRCASVAAAMGLRAHAVFLSNAASTSARDLNSGFGGAVLTSNESGPRMASTQPLMVARCVASALSDAYLVCGLKLSLSSGMRSSDLRVLAISWSNSGSIVRFMVMLSCGIACGCAAMMASLNSADWMIVLTFRHKVFCASATAHIWSLVNKRSLSSVLIRVVGQFLI